MKTRAIAAGLAVAAGILMLLSDVAAPTDACVTYARDPSCAATARPSATLLAVGPSAQASTPAVTPAASPTARPTAAPPVYTFRDEFDGTRLERVWGRHWPGFGGTLWSRSQVSVANGVLTITARRSGSKWVSGLIDTVGTFTQKYGVFSARVKFTEGTGLWPAFWLAQPQNAAREEAEIDVMEVCANPPGGHDGNDVTLLHVFVHRADGTRAHAKGFRTVNLAGAWHVYTVDWRPDHMTFYLDGIEASRFTSATDISAVRMAVVFDLAVGGRWCSVPDETTPQAPTMQVDWVRVTR